MRTLLSLACLLTAVVQFALVAGEVVEKLPDEKKGRMFGYNKVQQPITKVLQKTKGAANHVLAVTNFFAFIDKNIQVDVEEQNRGTAKSGKVQTGTCNMPSDDWQDEASKYLFIRGNNGSDDTCGTQREFSRKSRTTAVRRAVSVFRPELVKWTTLLNASADAIKTEAQLPWRNPVAGVGRFVYPERDAQNCTVHHTLGVRVRNVWYVLARITAKAEGEFAKRGKNSFLTEHVRAVSENRMGAPLWMLGATNDNGTLFVPTFNILGVEQRPAPDVVGESADVTEKLAFQSALSQGDNENQQGNDATQLSNIAILFLPLVMNLVPVAAIADVNTLGMLMYTALTDVLTTVPLCVKGIELMSISDNRFRSVSAQVTGKKGLNQTAVIELWAVSCKLQKSGRFGRIGIMFVVVSVTLMVFGVVTEFVARWVVKRRRAQAAAYGLLQNEYGHGTGGAYQPFTAAALTLQNRQSSARGPGAAYVQGYSTAARGTNVSVLPTHHSQSVPVSAYAAGPSSHGRGYNCPCMCHSSRPQGPVREYDNRPYPDLLDSKRQ